MRPGQRPRQSSAMAVPASFLDLPSQTGIAWWKCSLRQTWKLLNPRRDLARSAMQLMCDDRPSLPFLAPSRCSSYPPRPASSLSMSCQMVFHMPCLWQNSAMFSELEGLGQKTRVRWHDSRKTRTRPAELMHAVQQLGFTSPRAAGSRVQPVSGSSIIVIRGMAASHASHSHRRRHTHTTVTVTSTSTRRPTGLIPAHVAVWNPQSRSLSLQRWLDWHRPERAPLIDPRAGFGF
jgi:hypothetical protein